MTYTVEWQLAQDFLKRLKDKELQTSDYVLTNPLDHNDYIEKVGYLRGTKESHELFIELMKQYFPEYRIK